MDIIRKMTFINVTVHFPESEERKAELARRAADVHAKAVMQKLNSLDCTELQKLSLLDALLEYVKKENGKQA